MLHEEQMYRFHSPPDVLPPSQVLIRREEQSAAEPGGRLWTVTAVLGNTLAGSLFLGLLLALPAILQRVLAVL